MMRRRTKPPAGTELARFDGVSIVAGDHIAAMQDIYNHLGVSLT